MSDQIEYTAKIVRGKRVLHETEHYPTQNPYLWAHVQGRFGFDVVSISDNGNADLLDDKGRSCRLVVERVAKRPAQ